MQQLWQLRDIRDDGLASSRVLNGIAEKGEIFRHIIGCLTGALPLHLASPMEVGDPHANYVALSDRDPVCRQHLEEMPTGIVKWFNPTKGFGFIQPSGGGGKDVFVHISAVERAGLRSLNEGQTIEYEIESNRGRQSAANLRVK